MGYEVEITRDPVFTRRPGTPITLDEWYGIITADDELRFEIMSSRESYPPTGALWTAHPEPGMAPEQQRLYATSGVITTKYPDEHLLAKMVRIARKLTALVIGDNGEMYDLDAEGKLIQEAEVPEPSPRATPFVYGAGGCLCRDVTVLAGAIVPALCYAWYQGLLTSFNQTRYAEGKDLVNYEATAERMVEDKAFLEVFCLENPTKPFVAAALSLIRMHDIRLAALRSSGTA